MAKKIASKKNVPAIMAETEPEKSFWLCDGRALKSLKELSQALENMDISVWEHHVTSEKNDFANWIEGVFGESQLGAAIRKVKSPRTAAKRIEAKLEIPKFWSFLM